MERRLAAILAADVVGYSRMMGADEAGTLTRLKARRAGLIDPAIGQHKGRIFKTTGDGLLAEFASVVDALRCAVAIQQGMQASNAAAPDSERIEFRIGINVGDIVVEDGDVYGDGVNVAARLEGLAKPGGICVSGRVQEDVRGKTDIAFEDAGEQRLKNIDWPVRVYRVRLGDSPEMSHPGLALPGKPSIAVLPFTNMSGDPEQEYFADGIVEEIITALSRLSWLFVIARNSSFTYKGKAVDVKLVGRELGVRYVLEGSVRKGGNKVRITGQLIDATTGAHLWADRFDGDLEDIFELQDQVTSSVVGAIAPKLERAEIERVRRKPTESFDAYDFYLRGLANLHRWTAEANAEAIADFTRAFELDPDFAAAYGLAARCYAQRKVGGWAITDRDRDIVETARLARRAVELGKDDAIALCTAGFALADVVGEYTDGDAFIERALALNPNLAWAWLFSGWAKIWLGESELAMERVARAMRLSPHDPHMFLMHAAMATAAFFADRNVEALSYAEMALRERPDAFLAACVAASCHALTGNRAAATREIDRLRTIDPGIRIANIEHRYSSKRPEDRKRWVDGLRMAGLPE